MVHNTGQRFGRDLQRESQLRSLKELKIHPVLHGQKSDLGTSKDDQRCIVHICKTFVKPQKMQKMQKMQKASKGLKFVSSKHGRSSASTI